MKSSLLAMALIAFTCGVSTATAAETPRKSPPISGFGHAAPASAKGSGQDTVPCPPQAMMGPGCVKPWDQSPPARMHRPADGKVQQRTR